jgi:hypothetical protein
MYFKKKSLILFSVFLILILIIINQRTLIANEIRIITCQPNFTKVDDNLKNEILDIIYGILNFSVNGCPYQKIDINIKNKDLEILYKDREKFLKNKILFLPNEVPAVIISNKKKIKAKIRIKGDLINNWNFKKQFSLKITLNEPYKINGMREFSLTKFSERQFPLNLIVAKQLFNLNIIVPNFYSYKININNENWGLMLAEEQFSDTFYNVRSIDKSPIFKFTNEIGFKLNNYIYAQNKDKKKINLFNNLSKKQGVLEVKFYNSKDFINNKKYADFISIAKSINSLNSDPNLSDYEFDKIYQYLDINKFVDYFLTILIWGEFHSHYFTNMRFYFNPQSDMIEPIPTDHTNNLTNFNKFKISLKNLDNFYKMIIKSEQFLSNYKLKLNKIDDNYFKTIENSSKSFCINFKSFKYYYDQCLKQVNIETLKKNYKFLKNSQLNIFSDINLNFKKNNFDKELDINNLKKLFFDIPFSSQNIYARIFDDGELRLYNLTPFNISIEKIVFFRNSNKYISCKKYKIDKNCEKKNSKLKFNLKPSNKMNYFSYIIKDFEEFKKYSWVEIQSSIDKNKREDFFDIEKQKYKPEIMFTNIN